MKYKIVNLNSDMKFLRDGIVVIVKRGVYASVSVQEYQFLAQVYGMSVKGEQEYTVRITKPAEITSAKTPAPIAPKKKRKGKKS